MTSRLARDQANNFPGKVAIFRGVTTATGAQPREAHRLAADHQQQVIHELRGVHRPPEVVVRQRPVRRRDAEQERVQRARRQREVAEDACRGGGAF